MALVSKGLLAAASLAAGVWLGGGYAPARDYGTDGGTA